MSLVCQGHVRYFCLNLDPLKLVDMCFVSTYHCEKDFCHSCVTAVYFVSCSICCNKRLKSSFFSGGLSGWWKFKQRPGTSEDSVALLKIYNQPIFRFSFFLRPPKQKVWRLHSGSHSINIRDAFVFCGAGSNIRAPIHQVEVVLHIFPLLVLAHVSTACDKGLTPELFVTWTHFKTKCGNKKKPKISRDLPKQQLQLSSCWDCASFCSFYF